MYCIRLYPPLFPLYTCIRLYLPVSACISCIPVSACIPCIRWSTMTRAHYPNIITEKGGKSSEQLSSSVQGGGGNVYNNSKIFLSLLNN